MREDGGDVRWTVRQRRGEGWWRSDGWIWVAGAYASPSGLQPVRVSADESFGCEWAYRARAVLLCSCSCSAQWPCCAVLCCAVPCQITLGASLSPAPEGPARSGAVPAEPSALPRLCRGNSLDCDFQTVEPSARSCFGAQSIECVAKAFMLADHRSKLLPPHKQPGPQSYPSCQSGESVRDDLIRAIRRRLCSSGQTQRHGAGSSPAQSLLAARNLAHAPSVSSASVDAFYAVCLVDPILKAAPS